MRKIEEIQNEILTTKLAHSDAARNSLHLAAKRDQAIQKAKQAEMEANEYERGRIVSDNAEGRALQRLNELEKEFAEAKEAEEATEEG